MAAPRIAGLTHYSKMNITNAQFINLMSSTMLLCVSLMYCRILGHILTICYCDLVYL